MKIESQINTKFSQFLLVSKLSAKMSQVSIRELHSLCDNKKRHSLVKLQICKTLSPGKTRLEFN